MLYLFDIDGTLIGGDGAGRRAFNRALLEVMGIERALDPIRLDGMTDPLICETVFQLQLGRPPSAGETESILAAYVRHLPSEVSQGAYHIKPGVERALEVLEARGAAVGLATGNLEQGARIKLERARLWHRFSFGGFGSDASDRARLTRIGIERGLKRISRQLGRDQIVVLGDTPHDIAAAHAAGATAIGVATGSHSVAELRAAGADQAYATLEPWIDKLVMEHG